MNVNNSFQQLGLGEMRKRITQNYRQNRNQEKIFVVFQTGRHVNKLKKPFPKDIGGNIDINIEK